MSGNGGLGCVYGAIFEALYVPFEVLCWKYKAFDFVFGCYDSVDFV